jgi:hypothetical protein
MEVAHEVFVMKARALEDRTATQVQYSRDASARDPRDHLFLIGSADVEEGQRLQLREHATE